VTTLEFALRVREYAPLLWASVVAGGLLLAVGGGRMLWLRWCDALRQRTHRAGHDCPCLACSALTDDEPDDLMAVADAVFDGDEPPTPVNEPRDDRWGVLDGRNRGAWLDYVSRTANQQNARWITGRQQEQAGMSLADEVAEFLAEESRKPGETTGEIRRGDPGE
jgi:hypothetical protein